MPRNAVVPARTAVLPILVIVAGLALVIPRLNRTSDLDEIRAEEDSVECGDLPGECATPSPEGLRTERTLRAADVCPRSGYLCVELAERDTFRIRRWTDGVSGLVVHVPAPDFEDAAPSRELHRAAVRGVKAWDGQPFAITVDERGRLDADVTVTWQRQLPGTRLGVTELQWSPTQGLRVQALRVATRSPHDAQRILDPLQIQLTTAHEMGHALGLLHSDSERDVMYPTNTATSLSAQDYRTMEALYSLENGLLVVRN